MRVLHIGKFWPPYAGGIERAMRDLCAGLAASGIDVDVLAHAAPGAGAARLDDAGIDVRLVACHGQFAYTPISPGFPRALKALIARQPDVIHLHLPNPAAFWVRLLPAARRLPWVLHWHADIPLAEAPGIVRAAYPLYRPWENALATRAARIIATSPGYRDASTPLAPWRAKTRVVPLGLAPDPTPPAAPDASLWRGNGLRLLAVGRLSHYKGYDILLRALAQTRGIDLVLIGDGECRAMLHGLVAELGLASRVHLAGSVDDTTRDAAYAAAELFCLPSIARSEAFGLVLLEAMRAGVAIVSSDVKGSGMHYVLDGGAAGKLVPAGDAGALAHALTRLAADPAERARLAAAGHARWREHFTLAAMVDGVRAVYAETLAGTNRA